MLFILPRSGCMASAATFGHTTNMTPPGWPDGTTKEDDGMGNTEHVFKDTNRHLVEVPDSYAIARWPRDAELESAVGLTNQQAAVPA